MFEQTMIETAGRGERAFATMAGFAAQCVLLTGAVLIPIAFPDTVPRVRTIVGIFTPAPPAPRPEPLPPDAEVVRVRPRPLQLNGNILVTPTFIPSKPVMIDEPPLTDVELGRGAVTGRVEGAVPEGVVNALANVIAAVRLQAPPPKASVAPTPVAPPPARIEVSRGVQEAMIVHRVMPVYPPLARQARISGVVELHGVITAEGRIGELRVIAGHPLLVQAAVEAVRQWVYRPTLLNGKPVEVEAPIVVRFTLN